MCATLGYGHPAIGRRLAPRRFGEIILGMAPAGSGRAHFRRGHGDAVPGQDPRALRSGTLQMREPTVTIDGVHAVLERGQHLVDSAPARGHSIAWCVEASLVGDLAAAAAVAALATGAPASAA
jgi:hypothetical protein